MSELSKIAARLWAILLVFWVAGCGGASESKAPGVPGGAPMEAPMAESEESGAVATAQAAAPSQAAPPAPPGLYASKPQSVGGADGRLAQAEKATTGAPADKRPDATPTAPGEAAGEKVVATPMLIYTANLQLAVFETKKAIDAAEKLARDSGGYLVRRDMQSITFRIPSVKFQATLDHVLTLGDVLHRDVSVRDVTEEFFDLQVRLRNLEAMRDRLEELLKRAQKVEEALAVERELERVAGEIERLKGRVKLLRELVAFSTITIQFQPRAVDQIGPSVALPFPWLQQLGLGELLRL